MRNALRGSIPFLAFCRSRCCAALHLPMRNRAAPAAASAMTKNRYPVHARSRAKSNPPSQHAAPGLKSDEPRRTSRASGGGGGGSGNFDGTWVAVAMGSPCGSSTERFVISGGSVSGELSSGSVSPSGATPDRRLGPGPELDQHRPFLRPQRLWILRAVGRLHGTLDSF